MYEPLNKLKYAMPSSLDQIQGVVPRTLQAQQRLGYTLCRDDDYGREVVRSAEAGLQSIGVALGERTSYKRQAPTSRRRSRA